ncbi:MAG TPA: ABC transporter substrate-binding protein, partial [Anaerolineaceae bacterium]|nr:ABC transporter substrate-binding protein [Anaerolineaceae bacterium]
LIFLYKDGTSVPALEDVRVRQALNYAIDREALANVISAGKGRPVSSEFLPGSDAHDPALDNFYPYDVEKAQQLLEEAGYADGFELTILSLPFLGFDTLAQAVASYWEAIGVETAIESKATLPEFIGGLSSGEFAVAVAGLGATSPTMITWNCCIRPGSSWNPDPSEVPELQALIDQLAVTVVEDAPPIAQEVNQYLTENAWFVPVVATNLYFLYDPSVTGGSPTPVEPVLNVVEIKPAP